MRRRCHRGAGPDVSSCAPFPSHPPPAEKVAQDTADLSPDESAVAKLLDDPEPVHIDRLAEIAPFGIARLQAALLGLVLRGAVDQLAGGYYLPRFPSPGR